MHGAFHLTGKHPRLSPNTGTHACTHHGASEVGLRPLQYLPCLVQHDGVVRGMGQGQVKVARLDAPSINNPVWGAQSSASVGISGVPCKSHKPTEGYVT